MCVQVDDVVHLLSAEAGSLDIAYGNETLRPSGPGVFANVEAATTLDTGASTAWKCRELPRMAVGTSPHRRILVSFRHIPEAQMPRAIVNRRLRERQKQLTAVLPVDAQVLHASEGARGLTNSGHGDQPLPQTKSTAGARAGTASITTTTTTTTSSSSNSSSSTAPAAQISHGTDEGAWEHAVHTPALEQEHVVNVYDTIAVHWDKTRHSPWPRVQQFLEALPTGSLVADVGCGNGKYMGLRRDVCVIGSDRSVNLCDLCARQGFEVAICDNMLLGFTQGVFDAVISIAVLHHFSTRARRLRAVAEMAALLVPGGHILIQAWALEQVCFVCMGAWVHG